ncbi:putative RNA-directed DNA polymerase from transposon BS [Takifugu flavidus]|uniref:Putative RNA-directed DNA polymerase from transposon BS n=1 Tax=Takifugu flavidus TaxID=433684 RepID=A0A5C6NRA0_9TELE|nr:putative RNA-directed DNA polymerase from transposon BS [Takifugu flavidus]
MRPYYLPREFSHVIALCVYIAPTANGATACEKIHSVAARLQTKHPEALLIISGDFNHVTLDSTLAALHQVIDCPTRNNRTIDLLYTNVKEAYRVIALPPLGKSDHNLVYVQPQYTPLVQRQAASTRSLRRWTPAAEEALKDCFNITDWDTVQCYPNNKPWVTQEVKDVLNKKKKAFRNKDREEMKEAQREVKRCLKEAKNIYRKKVEKKLADNNMRDVWEGVRTITGHKAKTSTEGGGVERANDLNQFFNRFSQPTPLQSSAPHLSSPAPLQPSPPSPAAELPSTPPPSNQPPTTTFPDPASPPPSPPPLPLLTSLSHPSTFYHPHPLLSPSPHPPCIPLLSPSPHPPCFTADQVRGELRKLRPRKAAGPDRVCPRLLKTCAAELGEPLQRVFNLSLELGKVPTLWKTSCIIPVPKKNRPSELNDFRPVALTSHLMKTLERLFLNLLRPQVQHAEDSLQFAYRDKVGVEDAIIYLLHRDKLLQMRVDPFLVAWISSYLTDRPQFVRMKDITSDTVVSSIGAPQGTVLSPILFTLYTSDFCYNSEMCHIQKFADDTAIVGCIRDDQEEEYRCLVRDFVAWCHNNGLQLNTSKTKELVIDFGRDRPRPRPVQIGTEEVEGVQTYKYLGLWLDNRLDWTSNTRQLYKKTQSRMYFLRRLRSFNICRKLLWMFYQSVVASVLSYAVVCWGGSATKADLSRLEKLIRRAGSVVGMKLEPLATVAERRTIDKLRSIMDNVRHPLHTVIHSQRSLISQRLRLPKFRTN